MGLALAVGSDEDAGAGGGFRSCAQEDVLQQSEGGLCGDEILELVFVVQVKGYVHRILKAFRRGNHGVLCLCHTVLSVTLLSPCSIGPRSVRNFVADA